MCSSDNSTTSCFTTWLCSDATNNKRPYNLKHQPSQTPEVYGIEEEEQETANAICQSLGTKMDFLYWNSGVQKKKLSVIVEQKRENWWKIQDCHKCKPRSGKVKSKCLESYRGRGQLCGGGVKTWVTKHEHHLHPSLNEATWRKKAPLTKVNTRHSCKPDHFIQLYISSILDWRRRILFVWQILGFSLRILIAWSITFPQANRFL